MLGSLAGIFDAPTDTELMRECAKGGLDYYLHYGCFRHPLEWWQSGGLHQAVAPAPPADALTNATGAYYDNGELAASLAKDAWMGTLAQQRTDIGWVSSNPDVPQDDSSWPTWAWIAIAATAGVLVIGGLRR